DDLMSEAYRNTLKEHHLTPISKPKIDAPVFEMSQSYHFSMTVPIITPVELGDYRGLHFDREETDMTSEEVEKELESQRNSHTNSKLAGKQADYAVTMHKVEEKQIPELDDAFAEKASKGEQKTLEDLRKVISDSILADKKRRIREELREKVINAVIDQSKITVH